MTKGFVKKAGDPDPRLAREVIDGEREMSVWLRPTLEMVIFNDDRTDHSISDLKEMDDKQLANKYLELKK